MTDNKLNSRQHRFVINLFQGMTAQEAYEKAGYSTTQGNLNCSPYILQNDPRVSKAIQDLRTKKEAVVLVAETDNNILTALTKAEKRAILADVLRNGQPTTETHYNRKIEGKPGITATMTRRDIIEAIREDNKMSGDYAPSKHLVAQRVVWDIEFKPKNKEREEGE